jgi:pilus assembly protein CpaC
MLQFLPTIMEGGVIRMKVMAEVSDVVPGTGVAGGLPVFSLTTRRVESTVEVGNGQTFAIGGLLSDRVQAASSRIPGLGDIPVLGALFASVQYQRNQTEMVVLVTPELVEPLDPHQVAPVPGADMTSPSDFDLFALGKTEGTPNPDDDRPGTPRQNFPVRVRPPAEPAPQPVELSLVGVWGMSDFEER